MSKTRKVLLALASPLILAGLVCFWLVQLVVAAPFLLVATVFLRRSPSEAAEIKPLFTDYRPRNLTFDRLADVSKLHGCNTRNVEYRWDVFVNVIESIKSGHQPGRPPAALDFGAGCLRDTYELAKMRFQVTACDLSPDRMDEGLKAYDWHRAGITLPALHVGDIMLLDEHTRFDLITAFDVVEHLHGPQSILGALRARLKPEGVMLVSVPNGRSRFERYYKKLHERDLKAGTLDMSGTPHVQFKSPAEWAGLFRSRGFEIVKHDMAVGYLVNDLWAGFYGVMIRSTVEPVIQFAARRLGLACKRGWLENLFYPHWLVSLVNRWDNLLKPWTRERWGWNLFVLKPGVIQSSPAQDRKP